MCSGESPWPSGESLSGLSMNVSGPLVSNSSGLCATGPLVNRSGPPLMSSPSALNVSSDLASSSLNN